MLCSGHLLWWPTTIPLGVITRTLSGHVVLSPLKATPAPQASRSRLEHHVWTATGLSTDSEMDVMTRQSQWLFPWKNTGVAATVAILLKRCKALRTQLERYIQPYTWTFILVSNKLPFGLCWFGSGFGHFQLKKSSSIEVHKCTSFNPHNMTMR